MLPPPIKIHQRCSLFCILHSNMSTVFTFPIALSKYSICALAKSGLHILPHHFFAIRGNPDFGNIFQNLYFAHIAFCSFAPFCKHSVLLVVFRCCRAMSIWGRFRNVGFCSWFGPVFASHHFLAIYGNLDFANMAFCSWLFDVFEPCQFKSHLGM